MLSINHTGRFQYRYDSRIVDGNELLRHGGYSGGAGQNGYYPLRYGATDIFSTVRAEGISSGGDDPGKAVDRKRS
jgi:hypothetical protein